MAQFRAKARHTDTVDATVVGFTCTTQQGPIRLLHRPGHRRARPAGRTGSAALRLATTRGSHPSLSHTGSTTPRGGSHSRPTLPAGERSWIRLLTLRGASTRRRQAFARAGGAGQEVKYVNGVVGCHTVAVVQGPGRGAGLAAADLGLADSQRRSEIGLCLPRQLHEGGDRGPHAFPRRQHHGVQLTAVGRRYVCTTACQGVVGVLGRAGQRGRQVRISRWRM